MSTLIENASLIFWDFDGVIKESVSIKTDAYIKIFEPYGKNIQDLVKNHHETNGGVSRFEKIPFYFKEYVGKSLTDNEAKSYYDKFSSLVLELVINSSWVPGVNTYLKAKYKKQHFILVTGTPEDEINIILKRLFLGVYFKKVFGAPMSKIEAVRISLDKFDIRPDKTVFIGDSSSDMEAAQVNNVPFLLRRTTKNKNLQKICVTNCIDDFNNIGEQLCV